ncbi:carbonic anhydrase 13-like [Centruroides sculpturatus]|uniref:carbonic anhydrase 13-like n=1 Tax=Centruroides sculpturatus TaxID=218467 RepID=UPI000C6D19E2|nr:carbonic anhydrase 13-like [Centruroides sculpturatus]
MRTTWLNICRIGIRWPSFRHESNSNYLWKRSRFPRIIPRMAVEWGYDQHNGPHLWCKYYPSANGTQQSPINIDTTSIMTDEQLLRYKLTWNYESDICTALHNTGNGWQVDVDAKGCLEGGPLQHNYRLQQFHCHWGDNSSYGSEHTVDGKTYSGEIHLVHWNADLFENFKEAARCNGGLAVLGVFLQLGEENSELNKLTKLMPNIAYKADKTPIEEKINLTAFLPKNKTFWTYEGSLTTPPCYESVTWIVFREPIQISEQQLEEFRKLHRKPQQTNSENANKESPECIRKNYRPTQILHNRLVREAFYTN